MLHSYIRTPDETNSEKKHPNSINFHCFRAFSPSGLFFIQVPTMNFQPATSEELCALSLSATLGKDQFSKTLLRNDEIKNIIIKSLLGSNITGSIYHHAPIEHKDDRRIDILYYPTKASDQHPPIIVEIQHKITREFINRLMRYALNVIDDTNTLEIVLVININGFSSRDFQETNFKKGNTRNYLIIEHANVQL